jgi:pimeloyl-ACP methyl ester carboxylesterase
MPQPTKLIFLPGAAGSPNYWRPVSEQLAHPAARALLGWPGFDKVAADPNVRGIADLVNLVLKEMDQPCALIAQSMGGVVAVQAALARPELLTHLVLAVTSGGVDMAALHAVDWRPSFWAANPRVPAWFADYHEDLAPRIGVISAPTLLVWGDDDAISPLAVGRHLQGLLPHASMHVVHGGQHDLAVKFAPEVAQQIDAHLARAT